MAEKKVASASDVVSALIASGDQVYGVNTGFGQLAHVRISKEELDALQDNLVRSHACGVGPPLPDAVVRLTMVLKAATLAQGYSGVSAGLLEGLLSLVEQHIYPHIPSQGSVGASGDLAPLAHMACALLGVGNVNVDGRGCTAAEALQDAGLKPLTLGPKEGLALLNGTQVSTALALAAVFGCERVLAAALVAGAMSADALKGSDTPFDERIHRVRRHAGQRAVAAQLRRCDGRVARFARRTLTVSAFRIRTRFAVSLRWLAPVLALLSTSQRPSPPKPTQSPTIRSCSPTTAQFFPAAISTPSRSR